MAAQSSQVVAGEQEVAAPWGAVPWRGDDTRRCLSRRLFSSGWDWAVPWPRQDKWLVMESQLPSPEGLFVWVSWIFLAALF